MGSSHRFTGIRSWLRTAVVVVATKENVPTVEVVAEKVACVAVYAVGTCMLKKRDCPRRRMVRERQVNYILVAV
jgi:hypothetical protein